MTEQEQKIGNFISDCVNRQSFTVKDMEEVLALIKEALPELAKEAGYVKATVELGDNTKEEKEELRRINKKLDKEFPSSNKKFSFQR